MATQFLRNFDGLYLVTGHPYDQNDLLTLKNLSAGTVLEDPINIEKVVVIPEPETNDLQPPNDTIIETDNEVPVQPPTAQVLINSELHQVAYEFAKYLLSLPNKTATASQACEHVYLHYPSSREILLHHGKHKRSCQSLPLFSNGRCTSWRFTSTFTESSSFQTALSIISGFFGKIFIDTISFVSYTYYGSSSFVGVILLVSNTHLFV